MILAFFLFKKKFRYSLHIAIVAISSTLTMLLLKQVAHRGRPDLPVIQGISNYSFPSGHALSAFVFCGIFIYIVWHMSIRPLLKWVYSFLLLCFAVIIGLSRIILRVHYPTDVIASFCLGIIWAITSLWLLRKISKNKRMKAAG